MRRQTSSRPAASTSFSPVPDTRAPSGPKRSALTSSTRRNRRRRADHSGCHVRPRRLRRRFQELDARYLAGEAAPYAHAWTAAALVQAAYNRHELPPTTADYVGIDHRRVRSFAPGDALPFLRATYDVAPNVKVHIEAVHRLNNLGVVITGMVSGTSDQGFAFELREVGLIAFKGDLVSRFEMFDETDLDAALARFDELQSPTPRRDAAL